MADLLYSWSKETVGELIDDGRSGWSLDHVASNQFRKRGVQPEDRVYVVGRSPGNDVLLLGKLTVAQVTDQAEAEALLGRELWEADDHVIAGDDQTSVSLDRSLQPEVISSLRFTRDRAGTDEPKGLDLDPTTGLPRGMALASARWLTPNSAALLDAMFGDPAAARRDPERIVADALDGMLWEPSIRYFGWVLAISMSVDRERTVVTDIPSERRFRIYCGVYTGASSYRGLLLASLDERELDPTVAANVKSAGGELVGSAGDSVRVPHSLVLGIPPARVDELLPSIEPAFRRYCAESASAGRSTHAARHRPDVLLYLRKRARDLGVGA